MKHEGCKWRMTQRSQFCCIYDAAASYKVRNDSGIWQIAQDLPQKVFSFAVIPRSPTHNIHHCWFYACGYPDNINKSSLKAAVMSKNYEQTGTSASRHKEPLLFVGPRVKCKLITHPAGSFVFGLFPGGILLHLFSCYWLHSVWKLVSANSLPHLLLWTHLVYCGFPADAWEEGTKTWKNKEKRKNDEKSLSTNLYMLWWGQTLSLIWRDCLNFIITY